MSRISVFTLLLLLAVSVALAQEVPEAESDASTAEAQAQPKQDSEDVPDIEDVDDATEDVAQTEQGPKRISGMSILGNQEAPKALVIVPWKSSQIGDVVDISTMLDDSRQPVDKEVFMRELSYYEIRSERTP